MWHLRIWFNGRLDSVRLMIGLSDIKGVFQPKGFYGSVIVWPEGMSEELPVKVAISLHWINKMTRCLEPQYLDI